MRFHLHHGSFRYKVPEALIDCTQRIRNAIANDADSVKRLFRVTGDDDLRFLMSYTARSGGEFLLDGIDIHSIISFYTRYFRRLPTKIIPELVLGQPAILYGHKTDLLIGKYLYDLEAETLIVLLKMLKHISDEKEKTNVDIRDAANILRQLVRLDKNAEKIEDRMKLFEYLIASANDEDFLAQLRKKNVLST